MQFAMADLQRAQLENARWPVATQIAAAASGLIALLSIFIAARRIVGAFTSPLPALPQFATAIFLLLWVWYVRVAHFRDPAAVPQAGNTSATWTQNVTRWGPIATLALVAFACSFPFARFIDWLIWAPVLASAWLGPPRAISKLVAREPFSKLGTGDNTGAPPVSDEQILQQLTRVRTADGCDALRGTLAAHFAPRQRTATLFVGFCPPFERLPEVEIELVEDELAEAKLTQVLHNGAQIDVRLPRAAESPQVVSVQFFACEPEAA